MLLCLTLRQRSALSEGTHTSRTCHSDNGNIKVIWLPTLVDWYWQGIIEVLGEKPVHQKSDIVALGLNPRLRRVRPTTKCLSHDTAFMTEIYQNDVNKVYVSHRTNSVSSTKACLSMLLRANAVLVVKIIQNKYTLWTESVCKRKDGHSGTCINLYNWSVS